MSEPSESSEELSADRRFRLVRLQGGGRVRLLLARSSEVVLDLGHEGCRVDVCAFDAGGRALLHLRLSREDGSLVMYPATLDLVTGLFYHGDPRQAHAPAGQAADLERMAQGLGAPEEGAASALARAVRWPDAERLAAEALPPPEPEPAPPTPAEAPAEPMEDVEPQQSFDGRWRLEAWTFEDGPEGYQGHARIVDALNKNTVFDLDGSNWYSRGRFNPSAYQLWLNLQHANGVQFLNVFIDLDCLLFWETDAAGHLRTDRMPESLQALEQRLMLP